MNARPVRDVIKSISAEVLSCDPDVEGFYRPERMRVVATIHVKKRRKVLQWPKS